MGKSLQVHLAKPGGQKEGPFTLEEIKLALVTNKYKSGDYWAWHEGLPQWVPLYEIKGIVKVPTPDTSSQNSPNDILADNSTPEGAKSDGDAECEPIIPEEPPANDQSVPPPIAKEDQTEETPAKVTETEAEVDEAESVETPTSAQQPWVEPQAQAGEEQPLNDFSGVPEEPCAGDAGNSNSETAADAFVPDGQSPFSKTEAHDLVARTETAAAILARLKESLCHKNNGASSPASGECFRELPPPTNEATSFFNAAQVRMPGLTGPPPIISADPGTPESESAETGAGFETISHDFQSTAVPRPPGSTPGDAENVEVKRLAEKFSSGMSFEALEQIFIFTTGDASVWNSPTVMLMLEAIVGEQLEVIRRSIPRDVIFNCDLSQLLKRDGAISDAVWRAMAIREPSVIARAQQKLCHTCVRTFQIDTSTVAALILFYNVQKLPPDAQPSTKPMACPAPAFARSPGFLDLR